MSPHLPFADLRAVLPEFLAFQLDIVLERILTKHLLHDLRFLEGIKRLAEVARKRLNPEAPDGLHILNVAIQEMSCDLCGICSTICPTGSLRYTEEGGSGSIDFAMGRCTGCRLCIEICPKRCVSSSDLDLGEICSPERTIVSRRIYRCRVCNFKFVRDNKSQERDLCVMCEKKRDPLTASAGGNR